jgi:hypothetical protein
MLILIAVISISIVFNLMCDNLKLHNEISNVPNIANNKYAYTYYNNDLQYLMNLNLKWILNDWWTSEKQEIYYDSTSYTSAKELNIFENYLVERNVKSFCNWRQMGKLYVITRNLGTNENSIRPIAHAAYCIAMALYFGYYDESVTGVSADDAKEMCIKLIVSSANVYEKNISTAWGKAWQSPLWAENLGIAAWLLWDDIEYTGQRLVSNMIINEANYVLNDWAIEYYRDKAGEIVYEGDTKGEEIAWAAKILALAECMYPENSNASAWREKLEYMLISATSTPEDIDSNEVIDGYVVSEILDGSNINSDGTVVNHGLYHIDYMTTIIEEMAETVLVFSLAGKEIPKAASFNLDLIFDALVNKDLGEISIELAGVHFYERDKSGIPTGEITMPGNNDWGGSWYASCYLADVVIDKLELDMDIDEDYKADVWECMHFCKVMEQILRFDSDGEIKGQFFDVGENDFVSGELFQMHNLVEAFALLSILG